MSTKARELAFAAYCGVVLVVLFALCLKVYRVFDSQIELPARCYVILRWNDVPQEYTVYRDEGESKERFAAMVIEEDLVMHRTFISMKGP